LVDVFAAVAWQLPGRILTARPRAARGTAQRVRAPCVDDAAARVARRVVPVVARVVRGGIDRVRRSIRRSPARALQCSAAETPC